MSQWTHVCGCVRIDSIDHDEVNEGIERVFGKIATWDSPIDVWEEYDEHPELYTPTGREGGVQYDVWENPYENHMASHTVSIWGDLRDYSSVEKIAKWFNKILYDSDLLIRDAVLSIDVEYQQKVVLVYDDDAEQCIVCTKEETK